MSTFVIQKDGKTRCKECNNPVDFLCRDSLAFPTGPMFYICWECRKVYQVGKGEVKREDLQEEPAIEELTIKLKSGQTIQKTHDMLVSVILGESLVVSPEENINLRRACDVLCWVLNHDHNETFAHNVHDLEKELEAYGFVMQDLGRLRTRQMQSIAKNKEGKENGKDESS